MTRSYERIRPSCRALHIGSFLIAIVLLLTPLLTAASSPYPGADQVSPAMPGGGMGIAFANPCDPVALSLSAVALPASMASAALASDGTHVYFFGGHNATSGVASKTIYVYVPSSGTLASVNATLPSAEPDPVATYDKTRNVFWIFPGDQSPSTPIYEFNATTLLIRSVGSWAIPQGPAAFDIGNQTILLGGHPATNASWSFNGTALLGQPGLPAPREDAAIAYDGDTPAYLMGGRNGSQLYDSIVAFSPPFGGFRGDAYALGAALSAPVVNGSGVVEDSCAYLVGGALSDGSPNSAIQAFNPTLDQVQQIGVLPSGLRVMGHAAVVGHEAVAEALASGSPAAPQLLVMQFYRPYEGRHLLSSTAMTVGAPLDSSTLLARGPALGPISASIDAAVGRPALDYGAALAATGAGLEMTPINATAAFVGIQSARAFLGPFVTSASVASLTENTSTEIVFATPSGQRALDLVLGGDESANLTATLTTIDNQRQNATTFAVGTGDVHVTVSVDSLGLANITLARGDRTDWSAHNLQIGPGPFYVILGRRDAKPPHPTPVIWQAFSVATASCLPPSAILQGIWTQGRTATLSELPRGGGPACAPTETRIQWGDGFTTRFPQNTTTFSNHTFGGDGTYVVKITTYQDDGTAASIVENVSVSDKLHANFVIHPMGLQLRVNATPAGTPNATYNWSWGDGSNATQGIGAEHTYRQESSMGLFGTQSYDVRLAVALPGSSNTATQQLRFSTTMFPGVVDGTWLGGGEHVTLSPHPYQIGAAYVWDWGDGTPLTSGSIGHHDYSNTAIEHTVILYAMSPDGTATISYQTITPTLSPPSYPTNWPGTPVGYPTLDRLQPLGPLPSTFLALSDINVPNRVTVIPFPFAPFWANLTWSWGDNASPTLAQTPTHTYAQPGTYNITMRVASNGTSTYSVSKSIAVGGSSNGFAPGEILIRNATVIASGPIKNALGQTFLWNWGDGTQSLGIFGNHTYGSPGLYVVRRTLFEGSMATYNSTAIVRIGPPASFVWIKRFDAPSIDNTTAGLKVHVGIPAAYFAPLSGLHVTVQWHWDSLAGEVVFATIPNSNGSSGLDFGAVNHTFSTAGSHLVMAWIDIQGDTTSLAGGPDALVTVSAGNTSQENGTNPGPPIEGNGSQSTQAEGAQLDVSLAEAGLTVVATAHAYGSNGTIEIDWGDGSVSQGPVASHTYAALRDYNVTARLIENGISKVNVTRVAALASNGPMGPERVNVPTLSPLESAFAVLGLAAIASRRSLSR
ncbi:MAG: PKD domain-containing protein [Thermoplasmatota archaeon]